MNTLRYSFLSCIKTKKFYFGLRYEEVQSIEEVSFSGFVLHLFHRPLQQRFLCAPSRPIYVHI